MLQEDTTKEYSSDIQNVQSLHVLMISTDRRLFEEGSAVRERIMEYGKRVAELHVVVFSAKSHELGARRQELGNNIFIYPTDSRNRWWYIFDAIKLGKQILKSEIRNPKSENRWMVTTQDVFETGYVGMKIAKKFSIPLQVQIHTDFLSPYFKTNILNKIRVHIARTVLPQADNMRVVSRRIADSLVASGYQLKTKPTILPIFVDAEKIENTPVSFDLRLKYPQFQKIILVASRLEKEKGVEVAIEAFKEVSRHNPKTGLVIVGSGSEKASLELQVASYKLQDSVVFEGWQEDLNSYYKGADIFLQTSLYEGYGMTLVEASLNKKPIVTTDVGIAGEGNLLIHTQHALVCPVGDSGRIAGYLNSFLRDLNGARAMGLRAYTQISGEMRMSKEEYYDVIVEGWRGTKHEIRISKSEK